MKITLTETGGFIGKTKKAETCIDLSNKEYDELLKNIATSPKRGMKNSKDAFSYFLLREGEDEPTPISINNIPTEYNELFDELFKELKIVRDSPGK